MFENPVHKRPALKQSHGFVPPTWHMREHVHAANEGQAPVDHNDFLVHLPEVDRARDLRCQFLVTRFQLPRNVVTRQDDCVNVNTSVLGIPKVR